MYAAEMSNMTDGWLSDVFLHALHTPKFVFGQGSNSDPAGGAYDASQNPLVGWGGVFPPHSFPLWRLDLGAFGASVVKYINYWLRLCAEVSAWQPCYI